MKLKCMMPFVKLKYQQNNNDEKIVKINNFFKKVSRLKTIVKINFQKDINSIIFKFVYLE